jgi:hypothetical protein
MRCCFCWRGGEPYVEVGIVGVFVSEGHLMLNAFFWFVMLVNVFNIHVRDGCDGFRVETRMCSMFITMVNVFHVCINGGCVQRSRCL